MCDSQTCHCCASLVSLRRVAGLSRLSCISTYAILTNARPLPAAPIRCRMHCFVTGTKSASASAIPDLRQRSSSAPSFTNRDAVLHHRRSPFVERAITPICTARQGLHVAFTALSATCNDGADLRARSAREIVARASGSVTEQGLALK